jgi:Nucleotidyl transferase AbiEii toxin, Type IV TA system
VKGGTLRKADPRVVTPFHVRLMQLIADAGPRYGASNLRLQGGTALAAYHLHHRESEDLDFFADSPIDARDWGKFVQAHVADAGIELIPTGVPNMGMARYTAANPEIPEQKVKIDLVQESPFRLAPLEMTAEGIWIGSYRDMCASKLGAILNRFEVRDHLDLHVILNPAEDGTLASEDEVRAAFSALLTDAMECDPGIGPEYAGQEISRGQNRPILSAFRLRVLRKIEEADIQRTLRICLAECARRAEVSL